jgi:hypothetical protein
VPFPLHVAKTASSSLLRTRTVNSGFSQTVMLAPMRCPPPLPCPTSIALLPTVEGPATILQTLTSCRCHWGSLPHPTPVYNHCMTLCTVAMGRLVRARLAPFPVSASSNSNAPRESALLEGRQHNLFQPTRYEYGRLRPPHHSLSPLRY